MRKVWMTLGVGLFAVSAVAMGPEKKPGLWEVTSTMTWVQAPFPQVPPSAPRTNKVCITQEMMDKYGAIQPSAERGDCKMENQSMTASGFTADLVCTGQINGKGSFQSTWTDSEHSSGTMHFTGSFNMGGQQKPVEWTNKYSSTFVSSDCGSVKPPPMPKQ